MRHAADNRGHDGHAQSPQRNESVFDLIAGEVAGDCTANADAQSCTSMENRILFRLQVEDISAVNQNSLQIQRTQEPEISVAKDSQKERTICANNPNLLK